MKYLKNITGTFLIFSCMLSMAGSGFADSVLQKKQYSMAACCSIPARSAAAA